MIYLVLILLAGVFALFHIFKSKDKFAKVINATFVVAIAITFIPVQAIAVDGYYFFAIGCAMVVLYAFSDDSFSLFKKSILISMGLVQLSGVLLLLGKYPYTNIAYLAGIITIVAFSVVVSTRIKNYSNEIGFLAVLMADAIIKVSMILIA